MMSITQLFNSGQCGCLGYDLSQGDDWKTIYYNSTAEFDSIIGDYDDDTKRAVVKEVCASTIYLGEHMHVCMRVRVCVYLLPSWPLGYQNAVHLENHDVRTFFR